MRTILLTVAVLGLCAFVIPRRPAATADYTLTGTEVWTEAKTYGFQFYPDKPSDAYNVSTPLDGVWTRLLLQNCSMKGCVNTLIALVSNGNMTTKAPGAQSRTITFSMFANRRLQPGWTIQSVELQGSGFTYRQTPRYGTDDMSFRVAVTAYGSTDATVSVKSVTLRGPVGGDWRHAFSAPVRREFTVTGIGAWSTAKDYGFTFQPLTSIDCEWIRGVPTGVNTELVRSFPGCTMDITTTVVASVVGGNMNVMKTNHAQRFRMFASKRLAPGWTVKAVQISNGRWIRQPAYGSDDMRFDVEVSSSNSSTSSIIRSVVLEGPSNAANWQDAFKGAR